MESVNEMTINSVMSGVVALVICGLIGLFFSFIILQAFLPIEPVFLILPNKFCLLVNVAKNFSA